jgi:hypothetical protein
MSKLKFSEAPGQPTDDCNRIAPGILWALLFSVPIWAVFGFLLFR